MRSHFDPRGSKPIRVLIAGLAAGIAVAAPAASRAATRPASGAAASPYQAVRTVAQDIRGATFDIIPAPARFDSVNVGGALYSRVSVPGAVVVEQPGKPALPTLSLYAAVPDGMSARLRVVSEEWADRTAPLPVPVALQKFRDGDDPRKGPVSEFTTERDRAVYGAAATYPAVAAGLGSGALVGEWWVVPVHVRPVKWDPRAGVYRVLRKMTVRVDFVPATDREMAGRPVVRPGAQARAWDRVQRGLVGNYQSARAFPVRPRPGTLGAPSRPGLRAGSSRLAVNPEWKLSVTQTGWVSVSYATLAASGFPSGIAIANVRVEERGYDDVGDSATATVIPVVARDNNANGTFDAGDAVTFYARSIRDRYGAGNIELRYSDVNVYWLTWGSSPSPRPDPVSGVIAGAATTPTSFRHVIRLEEDHVAKMAVYFDRFAAKPEEIEYLFWTEGEEPDQFSNPIPFIDPDPAQPFRIRARYQGRGRPGTGITHHFDVTFRGSTGVTDTLAAGFEFFDNSVWLLDTGFTIPGSHIGPGVNSYQHFGQRRQPNGVLIDGSFAFLDVIEATYNRLYVARGNTLQFTSGGSGGLFEIHLTGFTGATAPNVEIYDVTNPLAPDSITGVSVNSTGPGGWEAVFRTDASGGERRFIALVPGAEAPISGTAVLADNASNLRQPATYGAGSVARSIFISPEAFRTETNRLANFRRTQGYVVESADIIDIYDEFNGGIKSARAIRRYLRHAWLAWTPRPLYVVLVGDGSLDYRKHLVETSFDWVPTYFKFSTIEDIYGNELVAQDPYYSLNLSSVEPGAGDFVPSVGMTRVPVSNSSEMHDVVDKILGYEDFRATDSWRSRQILYSDDAYSNGITQSNPYCFDGQEQLFQFESHEMASVTASSRGGQDMTNVLIDMKTYTDAVPPSGVCKSFAAVLAQINLPGSLIDDMISEMNLGGLILNFETHANRYLISHEATLTNGTPIWTPSSTGTPDRIQNVGRPWYAMVWGCHTNQFADGPFMPTRTPVDTLDAIGEMWLLMPQRGSIGSLGSSALEYLQMNIVYNDIVARSFYMMPPSPDTGSGGTPQARWILGEVMLAAEVQNGLEPFSDQAVMNRTLHLFADPMLRMDALPPRIADVSVEGQPFSDNGSLTTDSPTDSLSLIANLRDEVGIDSVYVTERDIATSVVTLVDPSSYAVAFSDSSRTALLTGSVRPRVGNYDVQINAIDINGRLRTFTLQVRTPIRYLADGVDIVNGVFVQSGSVLRAEITSPVPLTADSLSLRIDGAPVGATIASLDATNRRWSLEFMANNLFTGTHTIQVAVGGRTTGLDQRTFQTTSEFTVRGVAVVDPRMQGGGCGGSVFQYELSAAARRVELQLFTIAGRRVASIDLPGQAGFNVFCWDGRDSRAHDTAQGVYLYRLRATDTNGKTVSRDGRMIRVR